MKEFYINNKNVVLLNINKKEFEEINNALKLLINCKIIKIRDAVLKTNNCDMCDMDYNDIPNKDLIFAGGHCFHKHKGKTLGAIVRG